MNIITKEQLQDWAQTVYENCGDGEDFSLSLYNVVMEMRDIAKSCPSTLAADCYPHAHNCALVQSLIADCSCGALDQPQPLNPVR